MAKARIGIALCLIIFATTVFALDAAQAAEAGQHSGHHDAGVEHGHGAQHHGKTIALPAGSTAPTLKISVAKDKVGGWNLHIQTTNFRFAPDQAGGPHREGEGHAHLYVNGEKVARIYGPWFHIGSLPKGRNELMVTVNANDHSHLAVGDAKLSVTEEVYVH